MTANQYVNAITKRIKCGGGKKKDIKRQLLMDINLRIDQGEELKDIILHMGSVKEIADSFNENISDKEQKVYSRNKVFKIVIPCIIIFAILIGFGYWIIPKSVDIEKSKYFDRAEVEAAMKDTVALVDIGDYDSLQETAISQLRPLLNAETLETAKCQISDDWGAREKFGAVYMVELVQFGSHYAVGEIMVSYENVSVTYRLTYDEDMSLTGLYMR